MIRRLVKFAVAFVIAAEWYARGGREFLFGEREETFGVGSTLRMWVTMPQAWRPPVEHHAFERITISDGDVEVGTVTAFRVKEDARDMAGYPTEQYEAHVEIERAALGYPINVAIAQAETLAHKSLASG